MSVLLEIARFLGNVVVSLLPSVRCIRLLSATLEGALQREDTQKKHSFASPEKLDTAEVTDLDERVLKRFEFRQDPPADYWSALHVTASLSSNVRTEYIRSPPCDNFGSTPAKVLNQVGQMYLGRI